MRILVVEDDRLLNNTLCYNLSAYGYQVDAALTKNAAEHLCKKQGYDLIVLDVNLPDGNGFDFCRDIKDRYPDVAVIFLTANDVLSLLKVTSQKFHQTLVMITHNNEIAQLADRIIRIEDGKIAK